VLKEKEKWQSGLQGLPSGKMIKITNIRRKRWAE
jgi:hypothetical protein